MAINLKLNKNANFSTTKNAHYVFYTIIDQMRSSKILLGTKTLNFYTTVDQMITQYNFNWN